MSRSAFWILAYLSGPCMVTKLQACKLLGLEEEICSVFLLAEHLCLSEWSFSEPGEAGLRQFWIPVWHSGIIFLPAPALGTMGFCTFLGQHWKAHTFWSAAQGGSPWIWEWGLHSHCCGYMIFLAQASSCLKTQIVRYFHLSHFLQKSCYSRFAGSLASLGTAYSFCIFPDLLLWTALGVGAFVPVADTALLWTFLLAFRTSTCHTRWYSWGL